MKRRGRLRVLLGAAPGVGKTYTMLEEGARLRDEGRDVVVAILETHDREATAAKAVGLETVPRRIESHRGVTLSELDLDAVLRRDPEVALVDELAHTNAPGTPNPKRWLDVQAMLDAGIDVITTVNIQHIESLGDVVEQITGVAQRETVPDAILRYADQVEVVDLAPQSLRDRLSAGAVYPAERIDAALSNYFRLGNLTALRELALLWLAGEVDSALLRYRADHDIGQKWEARERVVVALTGGAEGDTLVRRGARIAARSAGGDLLAVHVVNDDGLASTDAAALADQRRLVESLGGTFHQVVGSNIAQALVQFARASNATQLVIGVSRRSRLSALVSGPGIGSTVIRESGDIDVHIVTHSAAGNRFSLPRWRGALTLRRRVAGFVAALVGGPALTLLLTAFRSHESITSEVLSYQLLVVVVALIGGIWPALFAAILSGFTLDFFFVDPLYTITVGDPLHLLALILYVVIAVLVSIVVDQAARTSRAARRAAAESDLIASVASEVLRGTDTLRALVTRTRDAFGLASVRLVREGEALVDVATAPSVSRAENALDSVRVDEHTVLELRGRPLRSSDRRLLGVIVTQLAIALENEDLVRASREFAPLAAADRVRSAILAAVGHDLRRPLAAATAAVTGLRAAGEGLSAEDRAELVDTAETSLESLTVLLTNLLEVSRIQAGALTVQLEEIDVEDVLPGVLEELAEAPGRLTIAVASPSRVLADRVLLQRVLVNLLSNALRHSPADRTVGITSSAFGGRVQVRVVDSGPGVPEDRREAIFLPFQRVGDTDNAAGLGLGLALSRGLAEGMGGTLDLEDTPGGGATFVLTLNQPEASA